LIENTTDLIDKTIVELFDVEESLDLLLIHLTQHPDPEGIIAFAVGILIHRRENLTQRLEHLTQTPTNE
jgi:hypothetical protein